MFHEFNYLEFIQVWQMAENIYNDEEPDAQAADIGNYNTFQLNFVAAAFSVFKGWVSKNIFNRKI